MEEIKQTRMTVKLAKCSFAQASVEYLGHKIGGGKAVPAGAKVKVILQKDRPASQRKVRHFLGIKSGLLPTLQTWQHHCTPSYPKS